MNTIKIITLLMLTLFSISVFAGREGGGGGHRFEGPIGQPYNRGELNRGVYDGAGFYEGAVLYEGAPTQVNVNNNPPVVEPMVNTDDLNW